MLDSLFRLIGLVVDLFKPSEKPEEIMDAHKEADKIDSEIDRKLNDND